MDSSAAYLEIYPFYETSKLETFTATNTHRKDPRTKKLRSIGHLINIDGRIAVIAVRS